jgi:hypothetical protein
MQTTDLLYYLVKFIHFIVIFIIVGVPFITNNIYALYAIILADVFIVYSWYIYGDCILTIIESKLNPNNISISKTISEYLGFKHKVLITVPLISVLICLYQLHSMRGKCRKI